MTPSCRPYGFQLSRGKDWTCVVCTASKTSSQGNLWLVWSYNIPLLRRAARKGACWGHGYEKAWVLRVCGTKLQLWKSVVQAPDGHLNMQWMREGSFMRRESTNCLLRAFLFPAPHPSASSYFCVHLALSVFFRHELTNQWDNFYWHLHLSPDGYGPETYVQNTLVWKQPQIVKWWFRNRGGQK